MIILYEGHKIEVIKKDPDTGDKGIIVKINENKVYESYEEAR